MQWQILGKRTGEGGKELGSLGENKTGRWKVGREWGMRFTY